MVDNSLIPPQPAAPPQHLPPGARVYAVGDVHGHRDKLDRVHAQIRDDLATRPVDNPLLIHIGDLIDRGPDSAGTVALLANGPPIRGVPTVNLMGNHEWMMLHAIRTGAADDIDAWLDNGGAQALASWGLKSTTRPRDWMAAIPPRHQILLRDLALSHTAAGYLFVHAGVRPGLPMAEQRRRDMLWIRESFLNHAGVMLPDAPARIIVHGHTPVPRPAVKPNRIGIDTGAGKGGPLTCAILERDDVAFITVGAA